MTVKRVYEFLQQHDIKYTQYDHPAIFTAEEGKLYAADVPGMSVKNLFLCNEKKTQFYLVSIPDEKRANLKLLANLFGEKSLKFASEPYLLSILGLSPGSVSPLGLINDIEHKVKFAIDSDLLAQDHIYIHPNINTITLAIALPDFKRILTITGHPYLEINPI